MFDMFRRKHDVAPEPEPKQKPSDPILPCGVEKVVFNGQEVLLDYARIGHAIDGRIISGMVVDPITGFTTNEQKVISMNSVTKHVAMGWRNSDSSLHELRGVTPASLTR